MYIAGGDWDTVDTSPKFTPGAIGMDYNGNVYKYIQYSEEAAAVDGVAGEVCYYVTVANRDSSDTARYQVSSDLSACLEIGAGVLQAALSEDEWGWVQIKGHATLTIALTAGADGDPLTPTGATDGTLDVVALATDAVCAFATDASSNEIFCDFVF